MPISESAKLHRKIVARLRIGKADARGACGRGEEVIFDCAPDSDLFFVGTTGGNDFKTFCAGLHAARTVHWGTRATNGSAAQSGSAQIVSQDRILLKPGAEGNQDGNFHGMTRSAQAELPHHALQQLRLSFEVLR
ncbi:hypothetical protein [Viridibacterium curvum]